ncbi:hypothetical protein KRR26_18565 [Corallococcus sp. M34]|uniref:hypothetical protein n=1 Tax=Citreicoccus inhibens TaxID=2849499 RepID=UPI001C2169EA|nr:hypothetical protein [Citreicoccus inhibens]MBU8897623.1 hypothetical protein [Citreicoccus inhibens]
MMRRLAIASIVLTTACAGQQKTEGGEQKKLSTEEKLRITNQPPFDLVSCFPREVTLPQPVNDSALLGAILATRPEVMECLVDPKHRGPAATTKLTVKSTVSPESATNTVEGENLTPEGKQCIQQVVDARVKAAPLPAGAKPVTASIPFELTASGNNSVTYGINDGSDFAGAVRLAQKSWCECYAPFKTQTPPVLQAHVTLAKGQPTATEITFDPAGSTEGEQLASCLKLKLAAVPAKLSVDTLKVPYRFVTYNSEAATDMATALPPELRFFQLELVRTQRAADVAVASGTRGSAAEAYAAVVDRYKKTKDYKLFDELETKCNTLVKASSSTADAIQAQQDVEQAQLTLVQQDLKPKDPAWAEAETATQTSLTETQKALTAAKQGVEADKAVCPKKTYSPAPAKKK